MSKPKFPDMEELSVRFTEQNFLPLSWTINQPKIQDAMEIAAEVTAEYFNQELTKLRDEIRKMREKGDRPQ